MSVRRPTATSKIFKVINKSRGNTCVPVYLLKARQVKYEEQRIANTDIYRLYFSQYLKIFLLIEVSTELRKARAQSS